MHFIVISFTKVIRVICCISGVSKPVESFDEETSDCSNQTDVYTLPSDFSAINAFEFDTAESIESESNFGIDALYQENEEEELNDVSAMESEISKHQADIHVTTAKSNVSRRKVTLRKFVSKGQRAVKRVIGFADKYCQIKTVSLVNPIAFCSVLKFGVNKM